MDNLIHTLNQMMHYGLSFLIVLTVLVFIHEFGHYFVARLNGVRIESFSIGFGPELFGITDRTGTRWKFCLVPMGGYVKMFGDADPASRPSEDTAHHMSAEDRKVAFFHKSLAQRASIVVAGPMANFLFAIIVLAGQFMFIGQQVTPPRIDEVMPDSAAADAGMKQGDLVKAIDGKPISSFEDMRQTVFLHPLTKMVLSVERDGALIDVPLTTRGNVWVDRFGSEHTTGLIGVKPGESEMRQYGPLTAVWQAGRETVNLIDMTLTGIKQIAIGERPAKELGGPLRIALMSGENAEGGPLQLLSFMVLLSVNLGLLNLFPIPLLDGGHLLFYVVEALRGRPLGVRAQEYGFRMGMALVLTLLVFATWNDLVQPRVLGFFKNLIM